METREWSYTDKSEWGPGPWQHEPDKAQWTTASGLPGLIVRNPSGALCGYVGVDSGHALFGVAYDEDAAILDGAFSRRMEQPVGEHPPLLLLAGLLFGAEPKQSPETVFTVHGGLTFSDPCHEPTREAWERWRVSMLTRRDESVLHPRGDMAEAWRERGDQVEDYEKFSAWVSERAICHVGGEKVWWFGFDCAHCDDLSPKYASYYGASFDRGVYRDISYVRSEVESLARQLAEIPSCDKKTEAGS